MNDNNKNSELQIEWISVDDIKPYEANAKMHPAEQIEQIKESIRLYGFNDPIALWKDNTIIEGHGRLEAALQLGMDKVPIIRLDNLTDKQRREYTLVHNQLTMNSEFDIYRFQAELDELDFEGIDFGFDEPFSIDGIEEVNGYNEETDDREYFEKVFTFPIEKKQAIINYCKKQENYDRIIAQIIREAEEYENEC